MDAVKSAVAAPSPQNTQPWRFRYDREAGTVQVRTNPTRTVRMAEPIGWAIRIAVGAATYNMMLAFAAAGQPMTVSWLPANTDPELQALLTPDVPRPPTEEQERLYRAIPRRHSNRSPFRPQPVPPHARAEVLRAAREELAWMELVTGAAPVAAVADIVRTAQRILAGEQNYLSELRAAWTDAPTPDPPMTSHEAQGSDGFEAAPLVAVLGMGGDLAIDHLRAGYALQRVLLTITDLGLSCSLFSQPIEVAPAREQLRIALGRYGTPQMVLRIGYGEVAPSSSRRPVSEVIDR